MFTVLLVDDESMVLDSLRREIDWAEFGIDKVLTAVDANAAADILDSQRVDLLITDICMPHMSGLDLIALARRKNPSPHCVLLTAYSQFDYAREAIRLGVENYLLKPINISELEETIDKALDNLFLNRQSSERLFNDNIVMRWLKNTISAEELSERSALLGINLYLPCYRVVCIMKKSPRAPVNPFMLALKDALGKQCDAYACWSPNEPHILVLGGAQLDAENIARAAKSVAEGFPEAKHLAVAIGPAVFKSESASESYKAALRRLDMEDVSLEGFRVSYDSAAVADDENDELINIIDRAFQISDNAERQTEISKALDLVCESGRDTSSGMARINNAILQCFDRQFRGKNDTRKLLLTRMYRAEPSENSCDPRENAAEIIDYSYLIYQHLMNELSPVIHSAIDYVHRHYSEMISIKDFCAKYKISMPYFGHMFKTETGVFFNAYVAQYRICMALELLRATDIKINEIAERVGFSSASYFIACFRKQTGQTPIKYRSGLALKNGAEADG